MNNPITVKELKAALLRQSIKFPARAKKAELAKIWDAEKDTPAVRGAIGKAQKAKQAASMKATMKIEDRQVVHLESGTVYKNANQAYRDGALSSAVCDNVSGKIFGAIRRGEEVPVVVTKGFGSWYLASLYVEGMTEVS